MRRIPDLTSKGQGPHRRRLGVQRWALLGGILLLLVGACSRQEASLRGELEALPQPDLTSFEAAVQEQLSRRHQEAEASLAAWTSPEAVAEALGSLGRHYDVYELLSAAESCYRNAHLLAPEDYRWTYHLAVVMQATGRLDEAERLFRRALELQPGNLPAQVRLAETLVDANRPEAARQALDRALSLDSECALAHYFLGLLEQGEGHSAAAVTHLQRTLELQPRATIVHYPLAQALRAEGRLEEARRYAESLGNDEVRLADPLVQALGELRAGAAAHIRRAAKAQVDGYFEAAQREYELAIAADPENPEARQGLGAMFVEKGEIDAAIEQYTMSLDLGAGNAAQVHLNLGALEILRGQLEPGLSHYRKALEIEPQLDTAHFALAKALADAGRYGEAVTSYRRLLDVQPDSVAARLNLGLALARQGRLDAARQVQRDVLALDVTAGERAEALSHLAVLEAQEGRFAEAEGLYRQATEAAPAWGGAWFGLGNLLGRQGRYDEAVQAYRSALASDPKNSRAWLGEVTAHVLLEDWPSARSRLEEGLRQVGDDTQLQQTLARLLVTCPDPAVRDVAQGLDLAQRVFEAARSLEAAETIALALAAEGRAGEAVQWQQQIVAELERAGMADAAAAARQQLDLYRRQAVSR